MPHQAFTVTRTFGLKPPADQRACFDDVFGQALSLGNLLVQAGLRLDDSWFSGKGKEAVKRFYDEARKDPRVAAWVDGTHLRERACRCIAQNAYFALRVQVERKTMLSTIGSIILSLGDGNGFSMFDASFPTGEVVTTARERLAAAGLDRATLSTPFIRNTACQARNILREAMLQDHGGDIAALLGTIDPASVPFIDLEAIAGRIHAELGFLAEHFMKVLSSKLTSCFKRLAKQVGTGLAPKRPREPLEDLVIEIYHGRPASEKTYPGSPVGKPGATPLQRGRWDRQRQSWRDARLGELLSWIDATMTSRAVESLVLDALSAVVPSLSVERVISCLFKPRTVKLPRCTVRDASPRDLDEWLVKVATRRVEQAIVDGIAAAITPWTRELLHDLEANPGRWLRRPVIKGRAIPLGQDDDQVYKLDVVEDDVAPGITDVLVRLSFYSSTRVANATGATKARVGRVVDGGFALEPITFQLHRRDLGRFQALADAGFEPKQPTVVLRSDGKLVLAIPFQPRPAVAGGGTSASEVEPEPEARACIEELIARDERDATGSIIKDGWDRLDEQWVPPAKKPSGRRVARVVKTLLTIVHEGSIMVAAGDLGLRTDITASFVKAFKMDDGSHCLANIHRPDEARHFIAQGQLHGDRFDWLQPGFDPRHVAGPGNVKRKLHHLMEEARRLQSEIDAFKNGHPGDFKRHARFHDLRVRWRARWQKVRDLHDELARQLATRLVAACEHHDVDVLRLENLSWSRHSRKEDVGFYLKSNQVHWFFSKVQSYATGLAHRAGIDVELVNARYTSQDCSRCHARGDRKGKTFTCPRCNLRLDADLNAARNIAVANTSPFGTFKVPPGIPPRATRVRGQALPRPLIVEPPPLVHVT